MRPSMAALLGKGLAFPLRIGDNGDLGTSEGPQNVRESLQLILLTDPGERVRRRDFGAGLRRLLFEPNTPATRRLIQERIQRAIARWEPRVRVESVIVEETPDPRRLAAVVRYRLVANDHREQVSLNIDLDG